MKQGIKKPRSSSSSMARLTAQMLATLETNPMEDEISKSVVVKLDDGSLRMLDGLAKGMKSKRGELAQDLLVAAIADLAKVVASRVTVPELSPVMASPAMSPVSGTAVARPVQSSEVSAAD
jgi:hypothetical protein